MAVFEVCPVKHCGITSGQLKRHLVNYHGWRYTGRDRNMPQAPNQATLFDELKITKVEGLSKMPTDQAFYAFHKANPWVVVELEKIAWQMIQHGRQKIGIQACVEVFRWETRRHTISNDFKLNNNFCSRYARMILDRNPHWGQVFELRKLKV